eukprot:93719-Hanusia_phi.AAC.7
MREGVEVCELKPKLDSRQVAVIVGIRHAPLRGVWRDAACHGALVEDPRPCSLRHHAIQDDPLSHEVDRRDEEGDVHPVLLEEGHDRHLVRYPHDGRVLSQNLLPPWEPAEALVAEGRDGLYPPSQKELHVPRVVSVVRCNKVSPAAHERGKFPVPLLPSFRVVGAALGPGIREASPHLVARARVHYDGLVQRLEQLAHPWRVVADEGVDLGHERVLGVVGHKLPDEGGGVGAQVLAVAAVDDAEIPSAGALGRAGAGEALVQDLDLPSPHHQVLPDVLEIGYGANMEVRAPDHPGRLLVCGAALPVWGCRGRPEERVVARALEDQPPHC